MKRLLQQQDFKALFDCTLDAILVADDNGVYVAANAAACQLLQAPEAEILGRRIANFTVQASDAEEEARWQAFLQRGQVEGEVELICADGSRCIVEYRSKANFTPGYHLSVLRDITARRKAEAELIESNQQSVLILESVSDFVLAFDQDWNFLYANPQSEQILGRPPHEVIGKNLWEEYPDSLNTAFETSYRRAAKTSTPVHFQGYVPAFETWMEVRVYPSKVGVTVYLRDVTDRKIAEDNLRFLAEAGNVLNSSMDYDVIIENLAQLAIHHIADWCAIDVLEEGEIKRLTVVHKDPAKIEFAKEFQQLYPPQIDDPTGVPLVLRTGKSQLTSDIPDELLVDFAPDPKWLEMVRSLGMRCLIIVPLFARGQIVGAMTLVREKSGRSYGQPDLVVAEELGRRAGAAVENGRLFRETTQALRTAEEASRARDEFLAIVSHELKTPMTPILGWISLLKTELVTDQSETVQYALDVIQRNVQAQSQLVNDLLDVSRIITGKLRLHIAPIDFASLVRLAIETVKPAAQAKSIEVVLHLAEENMPLMADGERLQQVVWNLVSNAIKFTPPSGQVVVSLERVDGTIEFKVQDTGQGIPQDFLPYVFDRFRQVDGSSTREHGGLGLGLSIVRNIVELHGGTITVESPGLGKGSTFSVCLPLYSSREEHVPAIRNLAEDTPRVAVQQNNQQPYTGLILSGLRILVVEDMDDSRELICAILGRYGAHVRASSNVAEGIKIVQEWLPDAILSDIGMPNEDGYSFIKKVRSLPLERGGFIPAIALTAYARSDDRLKALASGFQHHMVKPADAEELAITIASMTGRISS